MRDIIEDLTVERMSRMCGVSGAEIVSTAAKERLSFILKSCKLMNY